MSYILIKEVPNEGKNRRFEILASKTQTVLGRIDYFHSWKKYVFMPAFQTLYDVVCLDEISEFIKTL